MAKTTEEKRAYAREYYDANKSRFYTGDVYREREQRKRARKKAQMREVINLYKAHRGCACGEKNPACLDMHHIDPTTKTATICELKLNKSWRRLLEEIPKCTVICSNCHRKLHKAKRGDSTKSDDIPRKRKTHSNSRFNSILESLNLTSL